MTWYMENQRNSIKIIGTNKTTKAKRYNINIQNTYNNIKNMYKFWRDVQDLYTENYKTHKDG